MDATMNAILALLTRLDSRLDSIESRIEGLEESIDSISDEVLDIKTAAMHTHFLLTSVSEKIGATEFYPLNERKGFEDIDYRLNRDILQENIIYGSPELRVAAATNELLADTEKLIAGEDAHA